jgi:hypothetical protein
MAGGESYRRPYGVGMSEPTHQLVIQFPDAAFSSFDDLVAYEVSLGDALGDCHEVDGHDIGSGEVNFFVFTDDPESAIAKIRDAEGGLLAHPDVRAAARLLEGEDFEPLWPVGDARDFTIL